MAYCVLFHFPSIGTNGMQHVSISPVIRKNKSVTYECVIFYSPFYMRTIDKIIWVKTDNF